MKRSLVSLAGFILVLLFSLDMKADTYYDEELDSLACLEIDGKILNVEDGADNECYVELISGNRIREAVILKDGKYKFKFLLDRNSFYSIRISKKGFVTRLISVNTELLSENKGLHVFRFETSLLNEGFAQKLNQEVLDFPVTIIQFDPAMDCFTYNPEYTAYIKKELYKPNTLKVKKLKIVYTLDRADLATASD